MVHYKKRDETCQTAIRCGLGPRIPEFRFVRMKLSRFLENHNRIDGVANLCRQMQQRHPFLRM